MPGSPYATLAQVKAQLGFTDTTRDAQVSRCLDSATAAVEDFTGRAGGAGFRLTSQATARVFRPQNRVSWRSDGGLLLVDEIGDTTGLTIEEGAGGSWSALDITSGFDFWPENAMARGVPVTGIMRYYSGWVTTPAVSVRITAKWGWPAIPPPIIEATIIQAARYYIRMNSKEGVTGSNDWGSIRLGRLDPDVQKALDRYVVGGFA